MAPRIILLTKQERFSREAQRIARGTFGYLKIFDGRVGDPEPEALSTDSPDFLISFLSPWIVRQETLDRCGTAINFHPGSVEYPGTGCYNFALYEGAREFGAVCHHMLAKVDTGPVVMERRFAVSEDTTVETLKLATMEVMIRMFSTIVLMIARREPLPIAATHWTRRAFTKREMEALKECRYDMSEAEVNRRVKASVYPGYPGPYLVGSDGSRRFFPVPQRAALA